MAKLTKAQMALLIESTRDIGTACTDKYAPLQTLRERGLVSVLVSKYGRCTVKATDAGRAALASIPEQRGRESCAPRDPLSAREGNANG